MRRAWLPVALLLGLGYAAVGIGFAAPVSNARTWRLAAWAVSAVGFAAHLLFERFILKHAPARAAWHVAIAAAVGAFGLAVGANVNAVLVGSPGPHRLRLLLSLAIWPAFIATPAFAVAFAVNVALARLVGNPRG